MQLRRQSIEVHMLVPQFQTQAIGGAAPASPEAMR